MIEWWTTNKWLFTNNCAIAFNKNACTQLSCKWWNPFELIWLPQTIKHKRWLNKECLKLNSKLAFYWLDPITYNSDYEQSLCNYCGNECCVVRAWFHYAMPSQKSFQSFSFHFHPFWSIFYGISKTQMYTKCTKGVTNNDSPRVPASKTQVTKSKKKSAIKLKATWFIPFGAFLCPVARLRRVTNVLSLPFASSHSVWCGRDLRSQLFFIFLFILIHLSHSQSCSQQQSLWECVQRPNQLQPNYLETLNDLMVTTYRRTEFFITFHG